MEILNTVRKIPKPLAKIAVIAALLPAGNIALHDFQATQERRSDFTSDCYADHPGQGFIEDCSNGADFNRELADLGVVVVGFGGSIALGSSVLLQAGRQTRRRFQTV